MWGLSPTIFLFFTFWCILGFSQNIVQVTTQTPTLTMLVALLYTK